MDSCGEENKYKSLLTRDFLMLYIIWIFLSSRKASGTKCTAHYDAIRSSTNALGEIKSPNFGISAYPRGMCFTYQILAKPNEIIHLKLIDFNVGTERNENGCESDFVDVHIEGYYLHRLCGDRSGIEIRGIRNITLVLYSLSNNTIFNPLQHTQHPFGFRIFYDFQYKVGCGKLVHKSTDYKSGLISSPGYETTGYLPLTDCIYEFVGASHERVVIEFLDVDLAVSSACHEDYIAVFNLFYDRPSLILEHFCGSPKVNKLVSDSNRIQIRFHSSAIRWEKYRGFKASYKFIPIEELARAETDSRLCGTDFFVGWSGQVTSPKVTSPPSSVESVKCAWIIRVPEGWQILLNLVELKLLRTASCASLALTVYDGYPTRNQNPRDKFCGLNGNLEHDIQIVSYSNVLFLRFHAKDNLGASYGSFRIVYIATMQKFDSCPGFQCKGAVQCRDAAKLSCINLPRYCLHKSAKCDGLESCPVLDGSDEVDCLSPQLLVYVIGGIVFAATVITITIVLIVITCRRRRQGKVRSAAGNGQSLSIYSASNGSLPNTCRSQKTSLTDLHLTGNAHNRKESLSRKPILRLTFADDHGIEMSRDLATPPDSPLKFAKIQTSKGSDYPAVRYTPAPMSNYTSISEKIPGKNESTLTEGSTAHNNSTT